MHHIHLTVLHSVLFSTSFSFLQLKRSKPAPCNLLHTAPHHPQQPLAMHPAITTLGCSPCVLTKCLRHGAFGVALQTYLFWKNIWDGEKEEWGRAQACTMNHESVRPLFSFVALNNWQSSWDLVCFLNHINKVCQLDVEGHFQQRLGELGAQIPLT